jgi:hypothetical protein
VPITFSLAHQHSLETDHGTPLAFGLPRPEGERFDMLRISQVAGHDLLLTLKVEGALRGPWVAELAGACAEQPCSPAGLRLDLSAVTFVDGPGLELLRGLLASGATLAACSGLVAELLHGESR